MTRMNVDSWGKTERRPKLRKALSQCTELTIRTTHCTTSGKGERSRQFILVLQYTVNSVN